MSDQSAIVRDESHGLEIRTPENVENDFANNHVDMALRKELEVTPVRSVIRPARRIRDTTEWTTLEDAVAAGVALPCHQVDPDLFFADAPSDIEQAKSLCADCPVRTLCLQTALSRREPWGVWGGEWFVGGQAVGRKRPRGRPRKARAVCVA